MHQSDSEAFTKQEHIWHSVAQLQCNPKAILYNGTPGPGKAGGEGPGIPGPGVGGPGGAGPGLGKLGGVPGNGGGDGPGTPGPGTSGGDGVCGGVTGGGKGASPGGLIWAFGMGIDGGEFGGRMGTPSGGCVGAGTPGGKITSQLATCSPKITSWQSIKRDSWSRYIRIHPEPMLNIEDGRSKHLVVPNVKFLLHLRK